MPAKKEPMVRTNVHFSAEHKQKLQAIAEAHGLAGIAAANRYVVEHYLDPEEEAELEALAEYLDEYGDAMIASLDHSIELAEALRQRTEEMIDEQHSIERGAQGGGSG